MKAHFYLPSRVSASFLPYFIRRGRYRRRKFREVEYASIVELNREGESSPVVSDYEYGPYWEVAPRNEAKQIN